jgi:hypothetical protein
MEPDRVMPPSGSGMFPLYRPNVSVAATALRNAAYCPIVTSFAPMLYSYATEP